MRNRWIVMILVLSLAINMAALVTAGYNYYRKSSQPTLTSDHSHEMNHHFYEVLGLTPAQMTKMTPMAAIFHESLDTFYSAMNEKKDALIHLLESENVKPNRIDTLRKEMTGIQGDIEKTVIAHVLDVKAILDPSQRERFFDLLRKNMHMEPGMFIRSGEK